MRIMIHTVPLWAPSGYGVQSRLLAHGLASAGHEVIASCYGGFIREEPFEGIPVLACGGSSKGVGRIAGNYHRAKADAMIIVADLWPFTPAEFEGLTVIPWIPSDCTPLSMLDARAVAQCAEVCERFLPVAMTQHGRANLEGAGIDAPVIPHMLDPVYKPGDRSAWRTEHSIDPDAFLVSAVGVNGDYPCRKAFPELLAAFQVFAERHEDARLYLHTLAWSGVEGVDLFEIMRTLGLNGKVGFPDQYRRQADLLGADYMAGMYRASDVLSSATMGEGFGVPVIESLACGTPVIGSNASSYPELITRKTGWLCDIQPSWAKLHNRWWSVPLVASLVECLEAAYGSAKSMRHSAAASVERYRPESVIPQWLEVLEIL